MALTTGEELNPSAQPLLTPPEAQAREGRLGPIRERIREVETEIAVLYRAVRGARESGQVPQPAARWTFDTDARDEIGRLHAVISDNAELRGVFADWLQSQGDPWGELIALTGMFARRLWKPGLIDKPPEKQSQF